MDYQFQTSEIFTLFRIIMLNTAYRVNFRGSFCGSLNFKNNKFMGVTWIGGIHNYILPSKKNWTLRILYEFFYEILSS